MRTRMQPIGAVFSRFPRVARDLSGKLGKQCDIVMDGKEVEVDKTILEAIGDPLTHLVRNSIDHGVELPEVRTAAARRRRARSRCAPITRRARCGSTWPTTAPASRRRGSAAKPSRKASSRPSRPPAERPRDGAADLPSRILDGGKNHRRQRPRRRHGRRADEHRKARRHGRRRIGADQGHDDPDHVAAHAGDHPLADRRRGQRVLRRAAGQRARAGSRACRRSQRANHQGQGCRSGAPPRRTAADRPDQRRAASFPRPSKQQLAHGR